MTDQPTETTQEPVLTENGWPQLLTGEELSDYDGAPYPGVLVAAAASSVRLEAGWHIAPKIPETVQLDTHGGPLLMLPTMRLGEITAVRDISGETPQPITDWRKTKAGMLYRRAGWPDGFEAVEVDMVHGYDRCPAALYSVIADRASAAQRNVAVVQESAGAESVSYSSATSYLESLTESPVVRRYQLQWGA